MAYKKSNRNALGINWLNLQVETGERIFSVREETELDEIKFAKSIGSHKSTVERWERGDSLPSVKMVKTLCEAYNVSADWLLDIEVDWEEI